MVWSFTDSIEDAMHYQNGIILVANAPADRAWVWENAAHVTLLSDDDTKTEYTFAPGVPFEVLSVFQATVQEKQVVVINLQPQPPAGAEAAAQGLGQNRRDEVAIAPLTEADFAAKAAAYTGVLEQQVQVFHEKDAEAKGISLAGAIGLPKKQPNATHFKLAHKTRGRWCACIGEVDRRLSSGSS